MFTDLFISSWSSAPFLPMNRLMVRSITIWLVTLALTGSSQVGTAQSKSPRQIAQEAFPSVVLLVMQDGNGQPISFGSGFVLRNGLVVTNYHVISSAARGYCKFVGKDTTHEIAGTAAMDTAHDLAIVAVAGLKAPALPIGDSSEVAVGDAIYAIGSPEGLEGTFSQGIVSAIRRTGNDTMLQITAPVSHGSSGGPILDSSGRTIGIAVATFKEGQNLNLAIPTSYLTALSARVSTDVLPLSRQRVGVETPSASQPTRPAFVSPAMADLRKTAEYGDAVAQYRLGRAYEIGEDVRKDLPEAFKWIHRAAEQGYDPAQYMLGVFYEYGEGVPEDLGEALRWYRMAAEQGNALGELGVGQLYGSGRGLPQDSVEAAKWFRRSADHGNAHAQAHLGAAYYFGLGVAEDYSEAAKWSRKAAEQDHIVGQKLLASMYQSGDGVPKDYTEAAKWFRKAADKGDAEAQYHLASMYTNGQGVPQNRTEAMQWYRKAADQGHAKAQTDFGTYFWKGEGVSQDPAEAAKWFRKAAEQGEPLAQAKLGFLYGKGEGVPQDFIAAHMWVNLATASLTGADQKTFARYRDRIAEKMRPEQIAEAQRLAREWRLPHQKEK